MTDSDSSFSKLECLSKYEPTHRVQYFTWEGSSLASKHETRFKVTYSKKHSSCGKLERFFKVQAYPYGTSLGKSPALPANMRLCLKCLKAINTLAYYNTELTTAIKAF